jgi:hypothetical protein
MSKGAGIGRGFGTIVLVIVVAMLVACGSAGSDPAGDDAAGDDATASGAPTATETQEPASVGAARVRVAPASPECNFDPLCALSGGGSYRFADGTRSCCAYFN